MVMKNNTLDGYIKTSENTKKEEAHIDEPEQKQEESSICNVIKYEDEIIEPTLRYPMYKDSWVTCKLGELMDVGSVKRVHQSDWKSNGVRFLRARDIVAEYNHKEPEDYLYISEDLYFEYTKQSGKVSKDDLLVTGVGTIGVPMLIDNEDPIYFKDGNVIWFKNQQKINGNFLYYVFTTKSIQNFIRRSAGVGTVGTYTIDSGRKTPVSLPYSKDEQQQIGQFFQKIDQQITAQQEKIEHLKQQKKALLQQMFPTKDSSIPRVRYPEYTEEWYECKLGDVCSLINGRAYSQKELLDAGKYPVLRVGNLYTNNEWYYSDLELDDKYYANKGDLLYTWSATFGPHIWQGDKIIYHYHIWKIELSKQLDKQFAIQLLEQDKANILSNKNGSTMVHITKKGMEEKNIKIPSLKEQQQIGQFFQEIEQHIQFNTNKLEHIKQMKKSLLQKMFV